MALHSLAVSVLLLGVLTSVAGASVRADMDLAAKQRKVAFILVTDQGAAGVTEAKATIQQAMKQVKKSTLIELDRSNAGNADLVAKFGLAGAPVPIILLAARNGALAGGLVAAQATPEQLIAMVPSPKKAEILQTLQGGKAVFISVSRKSMASHSRAKATCATACKQMNGRCVTVHVDMDDPKESEFLSQLKVNRAATEPVTMVVNAQGQVTGSYTGAVEVANLVEAATKTAGGCCPSTVQSGSKACPPTKK